METVTMYLETYDEMCNTHRALVKKVDDLEAILADKNETIAVFGETNARVVEKLDKLEEALLTRAIKENDDKFWIATGIKDKNVDYIYQSRYLDILKEVFHDEWLIDWAKEYYQEKYGEDE